MTSYCVDIAPVELAIDNAREALDNTLASLRRFCVRFKDDVLTFERERGQLKLEASRLKEERAQFAREAALVADHNLAARDLVELSIGGERTVTVPRKILTQFDGSMLAAMFSGRHHLATDDTGTILLNRDPQYFGFVLDYLRNGGQLPANLPADEAELERVKAEFDYFLLPNAFDNGRGLAQSFSRGGYTACALGRPHALARDYADCKIGQVAASNRYVAATYTCYRDDLESLSPISADCQAICVWELGTGRHSILPAPFDGLGDVGVAVHDDTVAVAYTSDLRVHQLCLPSSQLVFKGSLEVSGMAAAIVALSAHYCVACTDGHHVYVWDKRTWARVRVFEYAESVHGLALFQSRLLLLRPGCAEVHDLSKGDIVCKYALPGGATVDRHVKSCDNILVCITLHSSAGCWAYDLDTCAELGLFDLSSGGQIHRAGLAACNRATFVWAGDGQMYLRDMRTRRTWAMPLYPGAERLVACANAVVVFKQDRLDKVAVPMLLQPLAHVGGG